MLTEAQLAELLETAVPQHTTWGDWLWFEPTKATLPPEIYERLEPAGEKTFGYATRTAAALALTKAIAAYREEFYGTHSSA